MNVVDNGQVICKMKKSDLFCHTLFKALCIEVDLLNGTTLFFETFSDAMKWIQKNEPPPIAYQYTPKLP